MAKSNSLYRDRHEAAKAGSPRFFTGEPCKRGHVADRFVSNGGCTDCVNLKVHGRGNNVRSATFVFPFGADVPTAEELAALVPLLLPVLAQLLADYRSANGGAAAAAAPIDLGHVPGMRDVAHGMTEKAGFMSRQQYLAIGWTEDALIREGYMLPRDQWPVDGPVKL